MQARLFKLTLFLLVPAVLFVAGCSDDDETIAPPATSEFQMVTALGNVYYTDYTTMDGKGVNITAASVWDQMNDANEDNDFTVLDWRSADHFALGHIDGATNVSIANFQTVVAGLTDAKTVLNVCYTGQTASHATAYMNMLGIEAQNLKFGMCGWTADQAVNLAKWENAISDDFAAWMVTVESTPDGTHAFPTLSTGESTAEDILMAGAQEYLAAGWKTISVTNLYEEIEVNGNADDYFIVNYFNVAEYEAGHIPGAMRYQPKQALHTDAMLNTLPTDKKIVVYCFTGQTSSQVVAYLNAIGYDAYSLVYGVNAICHSNGEICTTAFHTASTNYPVTTD